MRRRPVKTFFLSVPLLAVALGCSGVGPGYVAQAAGGQLDLYRASRPIDEVVRDPGVGKQTKDLLREVAPVKDYARKRGLSVSDNYSNYVQLDRPYVVWFVNASLPLQFYPKTFWFPVVGSFPGLGWFDESEAVSFADELQREGWDVSVRGVRAFSTGGWFTDPIVSSMFTQTDNAVGYLVNIVLHESVHATVLIENQQYFNESLASFVADTMTPQYLYQRFGEHSWELDVYLERRAQGEQALEIVAKAYDSLEALYNSDKSDFEKTVQKQKTMRRLFVQLGFEEMPNNATLIGSRLYDVGKQEFARLYASCDENWRSFLRSVASLQPEHFGSLQREDFGPVVDQLSERDCVPHPPPRPSRYRLR